MFYVEGASNPRTFTSSDPLVSDVANAIEAQNPGQVVDVNKIVYRNDGSILTDFDIELNNYIIQVKSGGGKGLTTQLNNTMSGTNKTVIGYVPDIKPSVLKGANNAGFEVFTSLEQLLEFLR